MEFFREAGIRGVVAYRFEHFDAMFGGSLSGLADHNMSGFMAGMRFHF